MVPEDGRQNHVSPLATFTRLAKAEPAAAALLGVDGAVLRSRGEILAEASGVERMLAVSPPAGRLIGLSVGNHPRFLDALLGAWQSGLVPVLLDPDLTATELQVVCQRLGICSVLQGSRLCLHRTGVRPLPARCLDRHQPVLVKLTSGTTGAPRGILVPAASLVHEGRILGEAFGLEQGALSYAAIPLSHSYGFGNLVLPLLLFGSPFVLGSRFEPRRALVEIERTGAEVVPAVPFMFDLWSRLPRPPVRVAGVRLWIAAGAPLTAEVDRRFHAAFGRRIARFYGCSETGPIACDVDPAEALVEAVPVGKAMPRVELELRDAVEGRGRLLVRSPAAAAGYYPEPEPTLGDGCFLTDDLVRFDGNLDLLLVGRHSRRINVAGRKVQPEEIEAALAALPGVREALVLGIDRGGRVEEVAAVVAGAELPAEETLRGLLRATLSPFKIPRRFRLVADLPRTARGKVDVEACRCLLEGVGKDSDAAVAS